MLKNFQIFIKNNLKIVLFSIGLLLVFFIIFQTSTYLKKQKIQKTSIEFFKSIENENEIIANLVNIKNSKSIFSVLSDLQLIKESNKVENYTTSIELYRNIFSSKELNKLYKSSIAIHASYTLIEASYKKNNNDYIKDITFFIDNIDNDLENYISVKKELEYLLIVLKIDLNNLIYQNNSEALNMYNEIANSDIISVTTKERVRKIHEFQLYK